MVKGRYHSHTCQTVKKPSLSGSNLQAPKKFFGVFVASVVFNENFYCNYIQTRALASRIAAGGNVWWPRYSSCLWPIQSSAVAVHEPTRLDSSILIHSSLIYLRYFCFFRSAIVGGSMTLVRRRPWKVFSSGYCWVLRTSHLFIFDGLHMRFFFATNTPA